MKINSVQFVSPIHFPGLQGIQALKLDNPRLRGFAVEMRDGAINVTTPSGEPYLVPMSNVACVTYELQAETMAPTVEAAPPVTALRDAAEAVLVKRGPGRPPKRG